MSTEITATVGDVIATGLFGVVVIMTLGFLVSAVVDFFFRRGR